MSDIATISLRVNTSELERGNQELDRFQQTAGGAANKADDLNRVFRAGAEPQKKNAQSLKEQQQELQNLLNKISPVNRALNELEDLQSSLATFRGKGMIDDEDFARYAAVLDTTRDKLGKVMEAETADGRAKLEQAQAAQKAAASQEAFLKTITAQTATFKASKADIAEYRAAQMGISEQAAPIIAQMREQERAVAREADQKRAAAIATRGLKQAIAEQEAAERSAAAEARRAENTRNSYIRSLQDQASAIGKTRTELMQMKAAELGVTDQAAPFIARLREQDEAWKKGTISAGQYRQALRMLPAQFTDIATSIAGGMPLWMVMMQQGGQISDSFGGLGGLFQVIKEELLGVKDASEDSSESLSENANALAENADHAKGLFGYLTPARLLVGGFGIALTAMAVAAWQAEDANRSLYRAIVITGGASATTTSQLWDMAAAVSNSTNSGLGAAADTLSRLAETGKYTASQLKIVAQTSQQWTQVMGEGAGKIEAAFSEIKKSPVSALAELNRQYNFLSVAQLKHIAHLESTEGKQAAVTEGIKIFADTMQDRMQQIDDASTPLEQMWDNVKRWASESWASVGEHTIGALSLITDVVAGTVEQVQILLKQGDVLIAQFVDSAWDKTKKIPGMKSVFGDLATENKNFIAETNQQIADLQKSVTERDARVREGEMGYITRSRQSRVSSGPGQQDEVTAAAEDLIKKKRQKTREGSVTAGDRAGDTAQAELLALQAQLRTLQEHKSVTDVISQQRKDLQLTEAKFAVLEEASGKRKLSKQEQSLLASKEQVLQLARQKALIGDQITAQEQLNKRMDTARKYVSQMTEKRGALETGSTMSDRLAQRELAKGQLASGWQNAGGSLSDKGYQEELKAAEDYYAAEDKLRGDWLSGAEKGWAEYADSATNAFGSAQQVAQAGFNGLADMMTNLVTTGKSSIKEFGVSMLKMIVEVINKLLIAQAIQLAMGWISSGASASAGATSSNAFSGGAYSNLSMAYNGGFIPEYDSGGYTGDGGKYEPKGVVHGGEFVFTKEATKRIGIPNLYTMMRGYAGGGVVGGAAPMYGLQGSGADGVTVNMGGITVNSSSDTGKRSSSGNSDASAAIMNQLKPAIVSTISEQAQRPGTPLWNAIKGGR